MQDQGQGYQPCAFFSRKLKGAETRYAVHEKEMLGIVSAAKEWEHLLRGGHNNEVWTDHESLTRFFSQPQLTARQHRWNAFLEPLRLRLRHIPGRANVVADALSRYSVRRVEVGTLRVGTLSAAGIDPDFLEQLRAAVAADPLCGDILMDIRSGVPTPFAESRGLLFMREGGQAPRLYVPTVELRQKVMTECHDAPISGHLGRDKTLEAVSRLFYWPTWRADVVEFVKSCIPCQQSKASSRSPAGLLQPLPVPKERFECISMDLITCLPKTPRGFDAIATFVDRLTKHATFVPCNTKSSATDIGRLFFRNVFRHWGMPRSIVSDRDPRWLSAFWQSFYKLMGTTLAMSTAFHPQTDGQTERANRTIEDMLRSFVNNQHNNWDELLPALEFAYNNSVQRSTGKTPFFLTYGMHPRTPAALLAQQSEPSDSPDADAFLADLQQALVEAKASIVDAQERQAKYANRHRRDVTFSAGDRVWLDAKHLKLDGLGPKAKFRDKWVGPFRIIEMVGSLAAKLELPDTMKIHPVVHVSRLKHLEESTKFDRSQVTKPPPPVTQIDGQDAWEVECFVDEKKATKRTPRKLLVRFVGYGPAHDKWLPATQLQHDLGRDAFNTLLQQMRDERS